MLVNGNFAEGTYEFEEWGWKLSSTLIPKGWFFWYHGRSSGDSDGLWALPECKVQTPPAYMGLMGLAWKAFSTFSIHQYALGQRVLVQVGDKLDFWATVWPWSSSEDNELVSHEGSYRTRIGIDPTGGDDPNSLNVVWNAEAPGIKLMDSAVLHRLSDVTAKTSWVTVYLWGDAEWRLHHNDAWWNDCTIRVTSASVPVADWEPRVAALESLVERTQLNLLIVSQRVQALIAFLEKAGEL